MADILDDVISALQNYVVSPLNAFGLGGYVFDVNLESIANSTSDITDHYTEDNRALQDHIAIRPKRITLKGLVGELVYNGSGSNDGFTQKAVQKLTVISSFLPAISSAATQIEQTIAAPSASTLTLSGTANIYSLVKNSIGAFGNNSRQQGAYQYFLACQTQGILMGIQTPWEFLSNMAIESVTAVQPEESIFVTEFSVTFKQIRIAATQTLAYSGGTSGGTLPPGGIALQGDASLQGAVQTNNGIVPGLTLPSPLLPGAQGSIVSVSNIANSGLSNLFKFQ